MFIGSELLGGGLGRWGRDRSGSGESGGRSRSRKRKRRLRCRLEMLSTRQHFKNWVERERQR